MAGRISRESRRLKFSDFELHDWIVKQCNSIGLVHSTAVQENCIPAILEGRDCIGCSKTGSGKTLAFTLPILQKLCDDPYGIFALVLTPTRELALQIGDQFQIIGKPIGLKVCVVIGGRSMVMQGEELAAFPHVVIATPGRMADHLTSCNTFSLKKIKFLVVDEADRLLAEGFDAPLKVIFNAVPKKRQTLLFSATITDTLKKLQEITANKPFFWEDLTTVATVDQLNQQYVLTPIDVRDAYLVQIIQKFKQENKKGSIIIFTKTCKSCQLLSMILNDLGFHCVPLHSMISQQERMVSLMKFKSNQVKILLTTDVANRGLDIPIVQLVINHNVPAITKEYIHRVGRTARAGRSGRAITLVTQYDIKLLHAIEKLINTKLVELKMDETDILNIMNQVSMSKREATVKLDEMNLTEKKNIYKRKNFILEGKDPDEEEVKEMKKKKAIRKKMREKVTVKKKMKKKETSEKEVEERSDYEEENTVVQKNGSFVHERFMRDEKCEMMHTK